MTKAEAMAKDVRCQAFNQHLEVCLRPATKECTDDNGLRWFACDAERHDTKSSSHNVRVERFE